LCSLIALLAGLLIIPAAVAGPKIAFAKYEPSGKSSHLWTIAPDGSGLKRLTSGSAYDMAPAWSRGRGTIAFMRFASGDPYEGAADLTLMRSDGSNVRRLAYEGPSLTSGTHALAYSPNGRFLAGGNVVTPEGEVWKWAVTVLDLKTGKSRVVYRYQSEGGIQSLSWSPNGRQLAFTVEYGSGAGLFKVDVASGHLLKTHEGNYNTNSVSWRPDGKYLLCAMFRAPGSTNWTYLAKPDGTRVKKLGSGQGDPAYSPDGAHYAFVVRGRWGYPCTIKSADADGSDIKTLLKSPGKEYIDGPAWR
jgi:Tol biopolymer transport system component